MSSITTQIKMNELHRINRIIKLVRDTPRLNTIKRVFRGEIEVAEMEAVKSKEPSNTFHESCRRSKLKSIF